MQVRPHLKVDLVVGPYPLLSGHCGHTHAATSLPMYMNQHKQTMVYTE